MSLQPALAGQTHRDLEQDIQHRLDQKSKQPHRFSKIRLNGMRSAHRQRWLKALPSRTRWCQAPQLGPSARSRAQLPAGGRACLLPASGTTSLIEDTFWSQPEEHFSSPASCGGPFPMGSHRPRGDLWLHQAQPPALCSAGREGRSCCARSDYSARAPRLQGLSSTSWKFRKRRFQKTLEI